MTKGFGKTVLSLPKILLGLERRYYYVVVVGHGGGSIDGFVGVGMLYVEYVGVSGQVYV